MPIRKRPASASGGYFERGGLPSAYGIIETYDETDKLFIDIDGPIKPGLCSLWSKLRIFGVRPRYIRLDRTRRGWHVLIALCGWKKRLRRRDKVYVAALEKVALQAVLGSDVKREVLNLMRIFNGGGKDKRWNILYREKLK